MGITGCPLADEKRAPSIANGEDKPPKPIEYKELDLDAPWEGFELAHDFTTKGIQKFVADYKRTLKRSA
jgi:hypothetical protein